MLSTRRDLAPFVFLASQQEGLSYRYGSTVVFLKADP